MRYIAFTLLLLLLMTFTVQGQNPPDSTPITAENIDDLTQLQVLGRGSVTALALSSDVELLAVGTQAGVWLYETANLSSLPIFLRQNDWVADIAFSPDNAILAVARFDNSLTVWSLASRQIIWEFNAPTSRGLSRQAITFAADSQSIVAALGGLFIIFDTNTGRELTSFRMNEDNAPIESLSLSSEGKMVAIAFAISTGSRVELWDSRSEDMLWSVLLEPEYNPFSIWSFAFHPVLPLLAAGSNNGEIFLWDTESGDIVNQITESSGVPIMMFLDSGDYLVTATIDGFVRFWNIVDSELYAAIQSLIGFHYLEISHDGLTIYAVSGDERLNVWSREDQTFTLLSTLEEFGSTYSDTTIAYVPSEETVITATGDDSTPYANRLHVWRLSSSQQVFTIPDFRFMSEVLVSGDFIIGLGAWINIWSYETQALLLRLRDSPETIIYPSDIALKASGNLLAIVESSGYYGDGVSNILIWDISQQQYVAELSVSLDFIEGLAFNPVNEQIGFVARSTESDDLELMLWDYMREDAPYSVVSTTAISAIGGVMAFHPDGSQIAYYGDRAIRLYDLVTQTSTFVLDIPNTALVKNLEFNPSGDLIAIGLLDNTVLVSLEDGENPMVATYLPGGMTFTFSDDGSRFFSLGREGIIWVWGVPSND